MRLLGTITGKTVAALGIAMGPCMAGAQAASGGAIPQNSKPQRAYLIQMGAPYSGLRVVQQVTTFPDGTQRVDANTTHEWRDSEGRNRQDVTWQTMDGSIVTVCTIDDPVAQVRYIWELGDSTKSVVTETHYEFDGIVQRIWPNPPQPRIQQNPQARVFTLTPQHALHTAGESLAPGYINGVYAEGNREVEMIAPGQAGNETGHPVKRIDEIWMSPDLGMPVKTYTDTGTGFIEKMELKDIDRSEPDPSVFGPPAGLPVRRAPETDPVWKRPIGCPGCPG